ncbi:type II toxin-antitoxin system SpoIISA family toxin [Brevibacillus sp. NPDC058079]|uniref:type II toxin-antitoxin system SpoIISA family toxin n=1 Tax=Brevibacillus sp. NPDC058079 TaxID=3346330 RepID=UPI0036E32ED7
MQITFFGIFFVLFMVYLLGVLIFYWKNSSLYWDNLGRVRKTFYVLYLIMMSFGILFGYIDYRDWKLLTEFSALVVFVDLAVFQTPNILKLWNAEFQHEDQVRRTLQASKDALRQSTKKVQALTNVIQYTDIHFDNKPLPTNWDMYKDQLEEYLKTYSVTFDFKLSFFMFPKSETEEDKKESLRSLVQNIGIRHNKDFPNEEVTNLVESFSSGNAVPIDEGKLIAIPYYGEFYHMVITIAAKDVPVDWIDASHILNLTYIFDWFITDGEYDTDS